MAMSDALDRLRRVEAAVAEFVAAALRTGEPGKRAEDDG